MIMRWFSLLVAAGLTVGALGCQHSTEVTGEGGKKLKLSVPATATTVKQGDKAQITIKVTKQNFDDDVKLNFSQWPDGVKITDANPKIEKGGKEATFTIEADPKAKLEEGHKVKVSATGGGMTAGPEEFTLNVKEKK
jgi:hypothetical protein